MAELPLKKKESLPARRPRDSQEKLFSEDTSVALVCDTCIGIAGWNDAIYDMAVVNQEHTVNEDRCSEDNPADPKGGCCFIAKLHDISPF